MTKSSSHKTGNSGATLIELRRTQSGNFHINDAKSVDEWATLIKG